MSDIPNLPAKGRQNFFVNGEFTHWRGTLRRRWGPIQRVDGVMKLEISMLKDGKHAPALVVEGRVRPDGALELVVTDPAGDLVHVVEGSRAPVKPRFWRAKKALS